MKYKFKLKDFESFIPEHILNRGYDYYQEGHVEELKLNNHEIDATVLGTESYEVTIRLNNKHTHVLDTICTCPYDQGMYCKHIAAVFYQFLESFSEDDEVDFLNEISKKSKKELIQIIKEISIEYPLIIERYSSMSNNDEVEDIIDLHLDTYMEDGFISYHDVPRAMKGFEIVLRKAQEQDSENQFHTAIVVLLKQLEIYQDMDDSAGYMTMIKDEAISLLNQSAKDIEIPKRVIQDINRFKDIIEECRDISDWHLEIIDALLSLVRFDSIKPLLSGLIDVLFDLMSNSNVLSYCKSEVIHLKYKFLLYSNVNEANAFMHKHIDVISMQKIAIEKAYDEKNYQSVVDMCLNNIDKNQGFKKEWHHHLVKAYQLMGKIDEVKKNMRTLILLNDPSFYQEYKLYYDDSSWQTEVELILDELSKENYPPSIYEKIMIDEKKIGHLFRHVKNHPQKIFQYYPYLIDTHYVEAVKIMTHEIYDLICKGSSKKDHLYKLRYFDVFLKAFGKDETSKLIRDIRVSFNNRRALLEVLDNYKNRLSLEK